MKAYLDSNILIDYVWSNILTKTPKRKNNSVFNLFNAVDNELFEPVISNFSLMEVARHLKDYFLLLKVIKDGFGYREFSRVKINYSVDPRNEKKVDNIIKDLEQDERFSYLKVTNLEPAAFGNIELYIAGYIDFIDAFHLQIALSENCDFLLTKDEEFRSRYVTLTERGLLKIQTKVSRIDEFLQLLKQNAKRQN